MSSGEFEHDQPDAKKMDVITGKKSCQGDCFTPKRTLARTPPKKRRDVENLPLEFAKPPLSQTQTTGGKHAQPDKDKGKKKVQNSGVTPKRQALNERNSPQEQDIKRNNVQDSVIDDIPPLSRWEIPRTPVRVVERVQLQVSSFPVNSDGDTACAPKQRTPVRIKTPVHPLAHFTKATPTPAKVTETTTTTVSGGVGRDDHRQDIYCANDENMLQTEECGHKEQRVDTTKSTCTSPPISVSKGIGTLPGLDCTDNDLAFLRRMQSIRKYEELKAEADTLEKVHKTAAEQKEQFQQKVVKIERDLQNMKFSYQETVSSVQSLVSDMRDDQSVASPNSAASFTALERQPNSAQQTELTQSQLAQLRKLNQLSLAKVEKTEKELKEKLVEVEKAKCHLQSKITKEEERKLREKAELERMFETTKQEQQNWKEKVKQEEDNYTSLRNKLRQAQTELAALKEQTETENADIAMSSHNESVNIAEEKRRTEERLKRLIRRCELYIQRHQMLKEMGTKI